MENNQPSSSLLQKKTNFQSIEEFMKEQDELDAVRLAAQKAALPLSPSSTPPSKKARRTVDIDALALESKALEEIGDFNWIGRLLGKLSRNNAVGHQLTESRISGCEPSCRWTEIS